MIKNILSTLAAFLLPVFLAAQNLVPNNGFDIYTSCPSGSSQYTLTPPWFGPANQTGNPDYMNACFTGGQQGVPLNFYGYQQPVSPNGYYGMIAFYCCTEVREYMEVQLTQPLIAGEQYYVGFYVSPSDNFKFAVDHFGAYLSNIPTVGNNTYQAMSNYIPQIDHGTGSTISDTAHWTLISGNYTAIGGEQYITVGNFYNDANTKVDTISGSLGWAYYYVDEVFVNPVNKLQITGDSIICSGNPDTLHAIGNGPFSWATSTAPGNILSTDTLFKVTPSATTQYILYGNKDTARFTVSVLTFAETISALRDTVCEGTTGNLNLNGYAGDSIQWQSSITNTNYINATGANDTAFITHPLTQSTYFRAVVEKGICTNTTAAIQLIVPPSLTALFTTSNTGYTVSFNSNGSTGNITAYSWAFGDGTVSNVKNPTHTYKSKDTTYNVCLTVYDGSNCSYTGCNNVEVTADGIVNITPENNWVVYPNPFSTQLYISNNQNENAIKSIQLCDVLGRIVINKIFDTANTTPLIIDVSGVNEGVYFLKIKTNREDCVERVIKLF